MIFRYGFCGRWTANTFKSDSFMLMCKEYSLVQGGGDGSLCTVGSWISSCCPIDDIGKGQAVNKA